MAGVRAGIPIELVTKDLRHARDGASAPNADLPLARAALAVYERAVALGYGEDNITGVAQVHDP